MLTMHRLCCGKSEGFGGFWSISGAIPEGGWLWWLMGRNGILVDEEERAHGERWFNGYQGLYLIPNWLESHS